MVKKVIFVSLLTLAFCFSLPSEKPAPQSIAPETTTEHKANTAELHETSTKSGSPKTEPATTHLEPSSDKPANSNKTATTETTKQPENSTSVKNDTTASTTNAAAAASSSSTEKAKTTVTPTNTSVVPPSTTSTTMAPTTVAPITITTEKPDNNGTTSKPMSTTAVPVTAASTARRFDGPSFIGGITLTLGLLGLGFVGFKYYRTQTERNYHTL